MASPFVHTGVHIGEETTFKVVELPSCVVITSESATLYFSRLEEAERFMEYVSAVKVLLEKRRTDEAK